MFYNHFMEVLLPNGCFKVSLLKETLDQTSLKFIVLKTHELVAKILFFDQSHRSGASNLIGDLELSVDCEEVSFVGAGCFDKTLKPSWGSESCEDGFGFDRPSDPNDEKRILKELREELVKLFESK
jgi:hypothetical protein